MCDFDDWFVMLMLNIILKLWSPCYYTSDKRNII